MPSPLLLSREQRDEVLRLYGEGRLLDAVVYVRRVTGAGLADANSTVRAVLRDAGVLPESSIGEPSAEVLARGLFRRELVSFLDYGADFYAATREGAKLLVTFVAVSGEEQVRALAACFHADPWDFNTHALDPSRADLDALRALFPGEEELIEKLVGLREAGFQFFFRLRDT